MSSSPTDQSTGSGSTEQVVMPQMGVSVAEGTIVEWQKQPGDWVEADETLVVVSTDKIDVEIPAPAAGRLSEILVGEGETVSVGTSLAAIDTGAKPGEAHPEEGEARERTAGKSDEAGQAEQAPPAETAEAKPAQVAGGREGDGAGNGEPDRSRFYSPVVQRIAAKHGIDLDQVEGTGIGGRVRKGDVIAYAEHHGARAERPLHLESPYQQAEAEAAAAASAPAGAGADARRRRAPAPTGNGGAAPERREPMSPMRSAIARHMVESRRTSAHCTTVVEVDVSRVARRRRELKERFAERGVPLTYLAFVARATVVELERFPMLNASVDGDELVLHGEVNLGIAVALESGLIVPVIPRAQRLSLEGMAAAIADVAARAREGRLGPDEVHGGTFTITNPGQFGAVLATPIINQPQVAILDLEAIVKRPVAVETPEGDAIGIRPITNLCMSWDHRALDGADASRFLAAVKQRLESWEDEQ
jgi:2-oxoglutarate dehydrogenase dihydrolipoamide succinyltransferase (E2 component)